MKCSTQIAEVTLNPDAVSDVVSLDQVRMKKTAEGLLLILEASLPAGCSEWAARCRPDISRFLAEAVDSIRAAAAAGDRDDVIAAFNYGTRLFHKVAAIYRRESVSGVSEKLSSVCNWGDSAWAV